jgi:hypothetical protein
MNERVLGNDYRQKFGDLRVVALISAFNEADILGHVLQHLISQHVEVYLIDDGSSDGTAAIAERFLHRGLLGIERRPPTDSFAWTDILHRKEELACELDADWFMHHDADEFRESPWLDLDLRAAISRVECAGYNAIDFRVLNFRPTDDRFCTGDDPTATFRAYEPAEGWDRVQIKCWRKGPSRIDLVSSGGHEAGFPDRWVCPIQFILRHYPIRGETHGRRKLDRERLPRFGSEELARGWHVQYRELAAARSLTWDPAMLVEYDPVEIRRQLMLTPRLPDELERQRVELRRLEQEIHALRDHIARSELEAARALETERAEAARAIERQRVEAGRAIESQRVEAARAIEAQQAETERARAEAGRATGQVKRLLASRSWRFTRPLRWAYRRVRRVGPSLDDDGSAGTLRPSGALHWGDLGRTTPISRTWGFDRGLPVDRYYIHRFLEKYRTDIRGRVLEVKDAGYTISVGGSTVTDSQVIDVNASNTKATVLADLQTADDLPGDQFDCFILTQTLHVIYDHHAALRHAARLLKPGGVLLCTIPAVSRVNDEDGGLESGDYWRMTQAAVRRLFTEVFHRENVEIHTYGNVRTCAAFLYGVAAEELAQEDLEALDPWFPLIHCVRAVRAL